MQEIVNLGVGTQWIVGTKTITLTRIWMHHEDSQWEPWVAFEVRWKVRCNYGHTPWATFIRWLESDNAILQDRSTEQSRDKV